MNSLCSHSSVIVVFIPPSYFVTRGNKHHNNTRVSTQKGHQSSPYINLSVLHLAFDVNLLSSDISPERSFSGVILAFRCFW